MTRQRAAYWWIPWIFVGGMMVVVAVNAVLAFTAVSSFSGLETDGHYRKGLAYNKNLAAARAQKQRGWSMTHVLSEGMLTVTFVDHEGRPLDDLDARAILFRPTQQGHDQEVTLVSVGQGAYRAALVPDLPGLWSLRVVASRGDEDFQEVRRMVVSASGVGKEWTRE